METQMTELSKLQAAYTACQKMGCNTGSASMATMAGKIVALETELGLVPDRECRGDRTMVKVKRTRRERVTTGGYRTFEIVTFNDVVNQENFDLFRQMRDDEGGNNRIGARMPVMDLGHCLEYSSYDVQID